MLFMLSPLPTPCSFCSLKWVMSCLPSSWQQQANSLPLGSVVMPWPHLLDSIQFSMSIQVADLGILLFSRQKHWLVWPEFYMMSLWHCHQSCTVAVWVWSSPPFTCFQETQKEKGFPLSKTSVRTRSKKPRNDSTGWNDQPSGLIPTRKTAGCSAWFLI